MGSWAFDDFKLHCSSGFGWGRVTLLHSGWYGGVFWICAEDSDDNREMRCFCCC